MAVMTSDADTVALLERALDQTAGLIAAIEPGQAGLATSCAGWFGRDPDWTPPEVS